MMLSLEKIITVLSFCVILTKSKTIEVKCSEFCSCDTYQNLRRASCQNKRLISIEINMASEVQILDLGFNQISEFGDHIFKELKISQLKMLNVSHNKISHIHFNAFDGLSELKTLDLSFNVLRYITKFWLKSLMSLEELYLKGNLLRTINEQPHIESRSLKVLDLSECGLTHLKKDLFLKTPNLEVLDVSGNFLKEFKVDVVKSLKNLTVLNLLYNSIFDCKSKSLAELKIYGRNKDLKIHRKEVDNNITEVFNQSYFHRGKILVGFALKQPCKERKRLQKSQMFEKIIMQLDVEPDLEKNSWIFEEPDPQKSTITSEDCLHSESKNDKFTKTYSTQGFDGFLMQILVLSPTAVLIALFGYGIFIGVICGCFCRCNCNGRKNRRKLSEENSDLPDGSTLFNSNLSRFSLNNLNRYADVNDISPTLMLSRQNSCVQVNPKSKKSKNKQAYDRQKSNSFVRNLVRSQSTGSKPNVPKEENMHLMTSEFNLSSSTPLTPRKVYVLPNNVFVATTTS